jgi:hypothetical protein
VATQRRAVLHSPLDAVAVAVHRGGAAAGEPCRALRKRADRGTYHNESACPVPAPRRPPSRRTLRGSPGRTGHGCWCAVARVLETPLAHVRCAGGDQFALQDSPALDEQGLVERLVRDTRGVTIWKSAVSRCATEVFGSASGSDGS